MLLVKPPLAICTEERIGARRYQDTGFSSHIKLLARAVGCEGWRSQDAFRIGHLLWMRRRYQSHSLVQECTRA